jgi:CDP-glucose 4,6-dehydratase
MGQRRCPVADVVKERNACWAGKRVLITGHTGFKGTWLTLLLHRLGARVAGYSNALPTQPSHFVLAKVDESLTADFCGDIRNGPGLRAAFTEFRPEIVFHLAAQPLVRASLAEPVDTYEVNVMGTVNCLEAVRSSAWVKAAIIVTSDKVYADQGLQFGYRETDVLGGADPYSSSKACAELVVSAYRQSFMLDGRANAPVIATARAGNVVGGGDFSPARLVPDVLRALETGTPLVLRYPSATRPWQHVLDPLLGYLRLAEALMFLKTADNAWNFGPPPIRPVSVSEFVTCLARAWDINLPVEITSNEPKETHTLQVDSSKATSELGWHPVIPFERMLHLTAQWYRAYRDGQDMAVFSRRQVDQVLEAATRSG